MIKTVVYLLGSLPDSYEMLVTALEANKEVPDMETVIERQRGDYDSHTT